MSFTDTNWDEVDDSSDIPNGKYILVISAFDDTKTGPKGDYIAWSLAIAGLVSVVDPNKLQEAQKAVDVGRKAFLNSSLTPNSLWRLKRLIKAATGSAPTGSVFDPETLVGLKFVAPLTTEEGRDFPNVGLPTAVE